MSLLSIQKKVFCGQMLVKKLSSVYNYAMKNLTGLPLSKTNYEKAYLRDVNPLSLSFVGDGVHTLLIRTMSLHKAPYHNNELHILTSQKVCATRQAADAKLLLPLLNEDELFIYKKAKNAKTHSLPKNATLMEYHLATALEAVIGYLYLSAQNERLEELLINIYPDLGN